MFDAPRLFTVGVIGRARPSAVLPAGARRRRRRCRSSARSSRPAALADFLATILADLPPADDERAAAAHRGARPDGDGVGRRDDDRRLRRASPTGSSSSWRRSSPSRTRMASRCHSRTRPACGSGSPAARWPPTSSMHGSWSPPVGRRAGCAANRSTPRAMSAPDSTEPGGTESEVETRLRTGRDRGARPHAVELERDVPGRGPSAGNRLHRVRSDRTDRRARTAARGSVRAVYKPHRGERPLWDFPDGLYLREVAAYRAGRCARLGARPADHPARRAARHRLAAALRRRRLRAALLHARTRTRSSIPSCERICAFDIVANNTDRKSGHVLIDADRHLWGIDNGLSFHAEFKLRTVIWEFGGEPLPDDVADGLTRLLDCRSGRGARRSARPVRTRCGAGPGGRSVVAGSVPRRPDRPPLSLASRLRRPLGQPEFRSGLSVDIGTKSALKASMSSTGLVAVELQFTALMLRWFTVGVNVPRRAWRRVPGDLG